MPMRVSLCLIAHNEAANLPACLGSVADLVDEIIVVDTGSTDSTRDMAERLGARVFPFAWADDFAAARNESLRHATGDWIFWLDADEQLDKANRARLRALFEQLRDENAGYLMKQRSAADATGGETVVFDQCRLFRNRPDVRWEFRVHEQIELAVERTGGVIRTTDIHIEHAGYQDAAVYRRKAERNLRLLLLEDSDRPGHPFTLFNLGWTYKQLGQHATALAYYHRSLARCPHGNAVERKLHALLARTYYEMGQRQEALAACRVGRQRYPDSSELLFLEALALGDLGQLASAEACLVRLLDNTTPDPWAISEDPGMRGYKARHNLARIYRRQRRHAEAEAQWRAALAERPDCIQVLCELGELYLDQGRTAEVEPIVRQLDGLGPLGRLAAALLRAQDHTARGETAAARRVLEQAIADGPPALEPRLLLSRLLLKDDTDRPAAVKALRDVLAIDPNHAEARRNLAALVGQASQPAALVGQASQPADGLPSLPHEDKTAFRMRVSLCLIARNEAANLPACLGSVADLVDEMIVVDTGSTDDTREVAWRLGARVVDFAWVDDFAAARNESLRHATGDWIFWLDADERLDEANRQKLRTLLASLKDENAAYVMKQRSVTDPASGDAGVFEHARLFRNRPDLRWHYRVHEQILPALERSGSVQRFTDIVIEHTGYEDPALYRDKQERNLRLLQRQDAEQPNDSLTQFNLGLTCQVLGRPREALAYWRRSLELAQPTFSWVRKVYAFLAGAHRELGQPDEALVHCRAGLARYPDDTELLFLEASLLSAHGDLAGAEARLLRLLETPAPPYFAAGVDVGLRGYKARHNLALIYRAQQRTVEAEAQWRAVRAERPGYVAAALALGDLHLALRNWDALDQDLHHLDGLAHGKVAAAQLRAARHTARGEFAAARQVLEQALAEAPRTPQLLLPLSRGLLRDRDWSAAEKVLRELLALDPGHSEARNNLTVLLQQQGRPVDPLPPAVAQELYQRAEKAFEAGRHADAAVDYRSLLHAGFLPGVMRYRLALIADRQGDHATAWNLHQQALAVDPALAARITDSDCPHHDMVCARAYATEEVPHCPICGGASQEPFRVVNCLTHAHLPPSLHPIRRWVRCPACSHVFANPRPTAAALREVHDVPLRPQVLRLGIYGWVTAWSNIVHDLWERHSGGDFLDVGVGSGGLAGVAREFGYRVCGLDIHPAFAEQVGRLGVEFLHGDVATYDFGDRRFDVIALGDVIQHLADPRAALARLVPLLQSDGLVWLSTPNYTGAWARSQEDRDPLWTAAEHLHYFCTDSLARLLHDLGLEILDYRLSRRWPGRMEVIAAHPAREDAG